MQNLKIILEILFEIHIDFEKDYSSIDREYDEEYSGPPDDSEDETADEPEEKEPAPIRKPFNTGQCVICLTNKPDLLFIDYLHSCLCLECEEASPLVKCPSCRTEISTKLKI